MSYSTIKKETSEKLLFEGIDAFYNQLNEDAFIFHNQDLFDESKNRGSEKDAIVINLSKGYVLIVEAKNYLTKEIYYSNGISSFDKGVEQLKSTTAVFSQIGNRLKCEWKIIRILYGSSMDRNLKSKLCSQCEPFVMSKEGGGFDQVLSELISKIDLTLTNWNFAKDFYELVKCGKSSHSVLITLQYFIPSIP